MGVTLSMLSQVFPPTSHFSVNDIPDLSGKVIIVTGGYAGIGFWTSKALLEHNAKVYLAGRDAAKAEKAIADLKRETGGKEALFLKVDLAELKSVKAAGQEFLSKETRLDVLINNGGVMKPPIEKITADGYDLQWGTNVLGHFYLTRLLLPLLVETAKTNPDEKARIVNLSSSAAYLGTLRFDTFKDGPTRKKKASWDLYNQSKLGNVIVADELHKRYSSQGIVSTSVNPGNIRSELQRHLSGLEAAIINRMVYDTPYGALTSLWAATSPETADLGGEFLVPWARQGRLWKSARDPVQAQEVWTWLEEQVQTFESS